MTAVGQRELLSVECLRVELVGGEPIVEDVSLSIAPGEIVGLVGESGSGKTTTALALLGYARAGARIAAGTIAVAGESVDGRDERAVRKLRGRLMSYVPQNPGNALNPALRIGQAIEDVLDEHAAAESARGGVPEVLGSVELPSTTEFARRYPHQLSGGQQQRVTIAMAIVCEPPLVVLDEPTTGLDVITQASVLAEISRLRAERSLGMVYVSHDLAVVAQIADRICVMYAGRIVEEGPAAELLEHPRHPYTRGLIGSIPDHVRPRRLRGIPGVPPGLGERPDGCPFAPRCEQAVDRCRTQLPALELVERGVEVRCFEWAATPPLVPEPLALARGDEASAPILAVEGLHAQHGRRADAVVVAEDVSFAIARGSCVALVGESGSGKTTIAHCVAGLHRPTDGRILLDGGALAGVARRRTREERRRIQIVFQNPYDSLNPRHRAIDAVSWPARQLRKLDREQAAAEAARWLERVRLPSRIASRYPAELSGGELQRVSIARALAAGPELLVCDEVTSALDVSVQAAVLDLLNELRSELSLAILFITHDLGVVASVADRVLVLERGKVCEQGAVQTVLDDPQHPYTRRLIAAAPRLPDPVG